MTSVSEVVHHIIPEIAKGDVEYLLRLGNVTGAPAAESGNQTLCIVSVSGKIIDRGRNESGQRKRQLDKAHVFPQRLVVKLP